ncbi:MAG TPA: endopeptidase La [Clostridiales bacterium]|nr:endopeptidase La [Clostridiales bacterium]
MSTENNQKLREFPVLPLRNLVVFPGMMLHFDIGRKKSALAVEQTMRTDQLIFLTSQKIPDQNEPKLDDLNKIGVVARVIQIIRQPENVIRVIVEGVSRAKIAEAGTKKPYLTAMVEKIEKQQPTNDADERALVRASKNIFERYLSISPKVAADILYKIGICTDGGELCDYIAGNAVLEYKQKQEILETLDIKERLEILVNYVTDEIFVMEIENSIQLKAKERIDESQREYYLREQLRVIEDELDEGDELASEVAQYRQSILDLHLVEESQKVLLKECDKLEKLPFGSQEANVIRTYLDTCLELPWNISDDEIIDLKKARKELDKQHYGLTKIKDRIIEALAVRKLSPNVNGQILCLIGPPGVGKTSIAQSIATAINRKSQRIALGGVHDEAEIRGHRRTYIGAMPGRIINAIKLAGTNNPLIILDEIDKLGNDYKGDPTSALLEVLDSAQNSTYTDHYIDLPFDLSSVFFITTANDYSSIPEPLLDRMDIIQLDSYTREEKYNIARKHLISKQLKNTGIKASQFKITDTAIYDLIDSYTREAGVRSLERVIGSLLRKAAVKFVENGDTKYSVNIKNIEDILGPRKFKPDAIDNKSEVGVVNGLAWTSVGGTMLNIEVAVVSGTGKIELTGSLGDVMKESAKTAITCVRSYAKELDIDVDFYKANDIHIHAPEGAVPKDGPSAGITMATAIVSALTGRAVKNDVAMTGEITLRGRVLPIGGLKEKTMAAYRMGIKTVVIPQDNISDLFEVDPVVKSSIEFRPVSDFREVLDIALLPKKTKKIKKSVENRGLTVEEAKTPIEQIVQ